MNFSPREPFTRNQLVFMVEVMVEATINMITTMIPGRWIEAQTIEEWKEDNDLPSFEEIKQVCDNAIWQFGWNLSILYAQLNDDEIGESAALIYFDKDSKFSDWSHKWAAGEIGIVASNSIASLDTGVIQEPKIDVANGVNKLFALYLKKLNEGARPS